MTECNNNEFKISGFDPENSLYIEASAGTGKTYTIQLMVAKMIADGTPLKKILIVTYTEKAAGELKDRIRKKIDEVLEKGSIDKSLPRLTENQLNLFSKAYQDVDNAAIFTIHSFCQKALKEYAYDAGRSFDMAMIDDGAVENLVEQFIRDKWKDDKDFKALVLGAEKTSTFMDDLKKQFVNAVNLYKGADSDGNEIVKLDSVELPKLGDEDVPMEMVRQIVQAQKLNDLNIIPNFAESVNAFVNAVENDDKAKNFVEQLQQWSPGKKLYNGQTFRKFNGALEAPFECIKAVNKYLGDVSKALKNKFLTEWTPKVFEAWQNYKSENKLQSFNDMILSVHQAVLASDNLLKTRLRSQYKYAIIDEFQDTSTVQWANFKTLLKECMSQGHSNLIVGDVKQSIYRFRSGDWRLLNGIDEEFKGEPIDFQPKKTNWRSERGVINFNNAFFERAAEIEVGNIAEYSTESAEQLRKAYSDVKQEIPEKRGKGGLVHIELLPGEESETMCERTLQTIHDLMDYSGARQGDIAILVRWGKDIATLAKYIEEEDNTLRVVSAEAFRLDASKAVGIIVNAMTLLARPKDRIARAALAMNCTEEQMQQFDDMHGTLIEMTLHDMAEALLRLFAIDQMTDESAYVTKFFDHLHSFSNDMAPVLEDFLTAWEDEICSKTIQTADCDGIRIMTIHKSKGLEFKHVILPYCDWSPDPRRAETLWLQPKKAPFSRLPMVPVDYRSVSSLMGTIYEDDGIAEHIQNVVDNLNLLYVAMTRAGQSLFILGKRYKQPKSGSAAPLRSKIIEDVISKLPAEIEGVPVHVDGLEDAEQVLMLTYGKLVSTATSAVKDTEEKTASVFETTPTQVSVPVCSYEGRAEYRQSNASHAFADDANDESDRQRYIRIGMVMHQLFASIRTLDDVEPMLQRMEMEGILYDDTLSREELADVLRCKFALPQVKEWFDAKWRVYNECTLLTADAEHRPDRVITDGC